MRRAQLTRAVFRRHPGGGGGGATVNGKLVCAANVAALEAYDRTVAGECLAYVETLRDFYRWNSAGVAGTDALNFSTVAAFGGGDWEREGIASEEWMRQYVAAGGVFINTTTGDNENPGTALLPLKTARELDRRLHGLQGYVPANFDINIVTNLADDDPLLIRFDVYDTGQSSRIRIVGTHAVAAAGVATAVQAPVPATNTALEIVSSVNLDAHVGKYIEFKNAGVFRCSGWIDKIVIAGSRYRLSITNNQTGFTFPTAEVSPLVNNTFEVWNLVQIPDVLIDSAHTPNTIHANQIRIHNVASGGFALVGHPRDTEFLLFGCDLPDQQYFVKGDAEAFWLNCHVRTPLNPLRGNLIIVGGLFSYAGTGDRFFEFDASFRAISLTPSFSGVGLFLSRCLMNGRENLSNLVFWDLPAGTRPITVSNGTKAFFARLWGSNNAGEGVYFPDRNASVTFSIEPNLVTSLANKIRFLLDDVNQKAFSDISITNIRDTHGNEIVGPAGQIVTQTVRFAVTAEGNVIIGRVLEAGGAANVIHAGTGSKQTAGVCLTTTTGAGQFGLMAKAGYAKIEFVPASAPAVNNPMYLAANGQVQKTTPALSAIGGSPYFPETVIFMGEVIAVVGNYVLVALAAGGQNEAYNELVLNGRQYTADALDFPGTGWDVTAAAPAAQDSVNPEITVRLFDDTVSEGVGFQLRPPTGAFNAAATAIKVRMLIMGRPAVAPAGLRTVGLQLARRIVRDNTVIPAWATQALDDFSIEANNRWQLQAFEFSVTCNIGDVLWLELERVAPSAGTDLVGDWVLGGIWVWVVPP